VYEADDVIGEVELCGATVTSAPECRVAGKIWVAPSRLANSMSLSCSSSTSLESTACGLSWPLAKWVEEISVTTTHKHMVAHFGSLWGLLFRWQLVL